MRFPTHQSAVHIGCTDPAGIAIKYLMSLSFYFEESIRTICLAQFLILAFTSNLRLGR